jgi:hypothetical protein
MTSQRVIKTVAGALRTTARMTGRESSLFTVCVRLR